MSDSYRIKLLAWRAESGAVRWQADVYRPGDDTYPVARPLGQDREEALRQARNFIAADRAEQLPGAEWIEVP